MTNFSIPSTIKTDYVNFMAELFSNDMTSNDVTIYYPARRIACTSCEKKRPTSFQVGECVVCGGSGFTEVVSTASVRLRIHLNARQIWSKLNNSIQIAEGSVVTIGQMSDIKIVLGSDYALMYSDVVSDHNWKYNLASDPLPWGFGRDSYFIALWEKV